MTVSNILRDYSFILLPTGKQQLKTDGNRRAETS